MSIDIGDAVALEAVVVDTAGTPVTPATITLTITQPDGVVLTPTVPSPASPGTYAVVFTPTQVGRHLIKWGATGPDWASTDILDVRPDDRLWLVSLRDARKHLNLTQATDDEELRDWIASATFVIENYSGRTFIRRQFTESISAIGGVLLPSRYPLVSVESPSGLTTDGIYIYSDNGNLRGDYEVTYTAGPTVPPDNATRAALIVLKHMWDTQRATMPGEDFNPGMGYTLPNRAKELLGSSLGGVA